MRPEKGTPEYASYIERQREYGRRGGKLRAERLQERQKLRDDARALAEFAASAPDIAKEFLDAALGRGKWVHPDGQPLLDPKERISAMKVCLEFGIGRARQVSPDAKDPEPEQAKGVVFGVKTDDVVAVTPTERRTLEAD